MRTHFFYNLRTIFGQMLILSKCLINKNNIQWVFMDICLTVLYLLFLHYSANMSIYVVFNFKKRKLQISWSVTNLTV